jgi:hypothetical protein
MRIAAIAPWLNATCCIVLLAGCGNEPRSNEPDRPAVATESTRAPADSTRAPADSARAVSLARRALIARTHPESLAVSSYERTDSSVFVDLIPAYPAGSKAGGSGGGGRVEVRRDGSTTIVSLFR